MYRSTFIETQIFHRCIWTIFLDGPIKKCQLEQSLVEGLRKEFYSFLFLFVWSPLFLYKLLILYSIINDCWILLIFLCLQHVVHVSAPVDWNHLFQSCKRS